jgi:hypothetical protein
MDARREWTLEMADEGGVNEEVWILGQPPLDDYLSYVKKTVVDGDKIRRAELVDEWRAANDRYYDLAESEPGFADQRKIGKLARRLQPLIDEIMATERFRRAFDSLPFRFATVELDRMMVGQSHIDLGHAERLGARLPKSPTPEDVFRFCFPVESPVPDVKMRKVGSGKYMFWSQSNDLRFLEATRIDLDKLNNFESYGPIGALIGLVVGYGSNFLSAVESDNRLLLHNGHHRAYALRAAGLKYAPCILQKVTRRDELNLVASSKVAESAGYYFKGKRPPVLKDFFDPKIRKVLRIPRLTRVIELSYEVRDFETRDFAAG